MNPYTHLSKEERYATYVAKKSGSTVAAIARALNRHSSTISRELKRNTGLKGYRPKQAHESYQARRHCNPSKIGSFAKAFIEHLLKLNWSPEQINGALQSRVWNGVPSHEWIYSYISKGGIIHKHLRSQKTYRKRGRENEDRRGQIANRRSIHERDVLVHQNVEIGHFEGDTIVGQHHQGAFVTLVDRKSMYLCMRALNRRESVHVIGFCNAALQRVQAKTVTFDNGKEFSLHQRITSSIDMYSLLIATNRSKEQEMNTRID